MWIWELDHKESWAPKSWCFQLWCWRRLENLLDWKEIKPVNPKGNQSLIFIGRTDTQAEASILWPPDGKNWFTGKDPDAGEDWRQEEKGMTEDEMVGWNHRLNGHESEQVPGAGDGQGSLACCSPWGCRVKHDRVTELHWKTQQQQEIVRAKINSIISQDKKAICRSLGNFYTLIMKEKLRK